MLELLSIVVPAVGSILTAIVGGVIYLARKLGSLSSGVAVVGQRMTDHEAHCDQRWNSWESRYDEAQKAWGHKWDDHHKLHDVENRD